METRKRPRQIIAAEGATVGVVNDPEVDSSSSFPIVLSEERTEARGEQAELVAGLDAESYPSVSHLLPGVKARTWFQALFMAAGLLARMEVAKHPVAAVSSAALGIQVGRNRQQVVDDLGPILDLGVIKVLDPGNDNGDRHGVEGEGYRAARYATGDITCLPAVQARIEARVAARLQEAEVDGAFDQMAFEAWLEYQEDHSPERTRWTEEEHLGQAAPPAPTDPTQADVMPWIDQGDESRKLSCQEPLMGTYLFLSSEGMLVPSLEVDRGEEGVPDKWACAPIAPSPVWYLTWSDAFQSTEAGVLGWVLACKQVRFDASRWIEPNDPLGTVTGTTLSKLLGGSRQMWSQCLDLLDKRGFAEKVGGSGYRLRFLDLYLSGELHRSKSSAKLAAKYEDAKAERTERAEWAENWPESVAPHSSSRSKFAVWYLTPEKKAWHAKRVEHLIREVSDPDLRNFDTDLDRV